MSIILSTAYAAAEAAIPAGRAVNDQQGGSHYGHAMPSPDQLGGAFSFSTATGKLVTEADFRGRWTILYFGYSRCTDSCPQAIPAIAEAAHILRGQGLSVIAAFVDIEAPAIGIVRRGAKPSAQGHPHLVDRDNAMKAISNAFGDKLTVMSGTRGQLNAATAAFRVSREHVPARAGEKGHSINHSSLIYFIDPNARVAGYGYHTTPAQMLAQAVNELSRLKASRS